MKLFPPFLLIAIVAFCSLPIAEARTKRHPKPSRGSCSQGTPYRGCPACGTAKDLKHRTLNIQKNRDNPVTNATKVTVLDIRDPANNTGKFSPNDKVWVTGYVATVEPGGMPETCNCKRSDLRDVHINIVADPSEAGDQTKYVVVEFTPRWEKKFGFNDSDYEAMRKAVEHKIKDKWVKFSGWMMYDFIHENASQSTRPNQPVCARVGDQGCNWRATPWEVHPVTAYEIVSKP